MTTKRGATKTVGQRRKTAGGAKVAGKVLSPRARGTKFTAIHRGLLKKMLGKQPIDLIRSGLQFDMIDFISARYGLSTETLHRLIELSDRTAARRKQVPLPLNAVQSERLVRVVRAMNLATEVLEDADNARTWINAPNVALNDERPMSLLDTGIGYEQVMDVLRRIEFGVYS